MADDVCPECDRLRRLCPHARTDSETVRALHRAFDGEDLQGIGNGRRPDAIARAAAIVRSLADILYHPP